MDLRSCMEDGTLVFVDVSRPEKEGKCMFWEAEPIICDELVVEVVDGCNVFFDAVGNIFVDCWVIQMFINNLLDVLLPLPHTNAHIFIRFDDDIEQVILQSFHRRDLQRRKIQSGSKALVFRLHSGEFIDEFIDGFFNIQVSNRRNPVGILDVDLWIEGIFLLFKVLLLDPIFCSIVVFCFLSHTSFETDSSESESIS